MPGPDGDQPKLGRLVRVRLQPKLLEVQNQLGRVFLDARKGGELVVDAVDLDLGDGGAGQRGEQHPPQRVAERQPEAALQRLDLEATKILGRMKGVDFRDDVF